MQAVRPKRQRIGALDGRKGQGGIEMREKLPPARDFPFQRRAQGRRIRAWYSVPKDSPPGRKLPAVLAVPGYGGQKAIPTHLVLVTTIQTAITMTLLVNHRLMTIQRIP